MKKYAILLFALFFAVQTGFAAVLPAGSASEIDSAWTGVECTPAVVLCESLSILDARGDQGGKKVGTLYYSGQLIPVIESWDGYAKIFYADGTKTGWVNNRYLLMDPAWYVCDTDRQVFAYPDGMAPCIAYLKAGTSLPILTEYDDEISVNGWVCVSLRGAAGWIPKVPGDTAGETWFRPEETANLLSATLAWGDESISVTDEPLLNELSVLLTHAEDKGGTVSGCPFTATLTLMTETGNSIELALATDSCCVYRVDGRDYAYARHLWSEEAGSPDNGVLFKLFGIDPQIFHAP